MTKIRANPKLRAFTLIELLVVIAIIAVLAVLAMTGMRSAMISANKTRNISQMRAIGQGVIVWAAEKNNNEPMYFANGNGDSSSEGFAGRDPSLSAGNPAILLYNKMDITNSYIRDHTVFFSPLTTFKTPTRDEYDPTKWSATTPWGTYMWVYPSVVASDRTPRQVAAMNGSSFDKVGPQAQNKVLMFNDYSVGKPRTVSIYHALFRDGSVRLVVEPGGDIWGWFKTK